MIRGIGVDVVDVARFARSAERTPGLVPRLFAPAERALPVRSLAARFAAKEALIKALGSSDGIRWQEMAIINGPEGKPDFALSGVTAGVVAERGITSMHLTMTHDAGVAVAFVVAEREG